MEEELQRRAEDLCSRCERTAEITSTGFLTPADVFHLRAWSKQACECQILFHGGYEGAERQVAFFLPYWMDEKDFSAEEHLCAITAESRFGMPGHRDFLGAVLGLGIDRSRVGDIIVLDSSAFLICLPSVKEYLLLNLEKVGRFSVKVHEVALSEIQVPKRELKEVEFSVSSLRLDSICAGMFRISRSQAVEMIHAGLVSLNYTICEKPDSDIKDGDILSIRGKGKGVVLNAGDTMSRKGRLFVHAGIY